MNEAIKLAIGKGGYKNLRVDLGSDGNLYTFGERFHNKELDNMLVLDPLFWQALGKALEWRHLHGEFCDCLGTVWREKAHQYFDLLMTDGDTDKFWRELLTNK